MTKPYYTTTETAKLLSVSADTVLKWVRAGKIESYRTPGGHARIPLHAVTALLPGKPSLATESNQSLEKTEEHPSYKYCWDFYSHHGPIQEDCKKCVAFKSRAQRCYEMRDIPEQFGLLRLHCRTDCQDCEYYQLKCGKDVNALILIRDPECKKNLTAESPSSPFIFQFVANEYECSALIEKFRPDFVVVDCSLGLTRTQDLCRYLVGDHRIPNVRIILSSEKAEARDYCDREAFGWITRPFTIRQLEDLIQGAMN